MKTKLLFLILILSSCTAKKTTTEKIVKKDTLQTSSLRYVSQPISTTIQINDICDSLGRVKPLKQLETSGQNEANIRTENNTLYLDLITGLSELKTDTIKEVKYRDRVKEVSKVGYKTPFWMWVTILISIVLNAVLIYLFFGNIKKKVLSLFF